LTFYFGRDTFFVSLSIAKVVRAGFKNLLIFVLLQTKILWVSLLQESDMEGEASENLARSRHSERRMKDKG